jgi:hypothetical protein
VAFFGAHFTAWEPWCLRLIEAAFALRVAARAVAAAAPGSSRRVGGKKSGAMPPHTYGVSPGGRRVRMYESSQHELTLAPPLAPRLLAAAPLLAAAWLAAA